MARQRADRDLMGHPDLEFTGMGTHRKITCRGDRVPQLIIPMAVALKKEFKAGHGSMGSAEPTGLKRNASFADSRQRHH